MSFQQKNIALSLSIFSVIMGFYLMRMVQMVQGDSFNSTNVFRLWGIIALLAVIGTIVMTILTHIVGGVVHKVTTNEDPHIEDIQDERDILIDLKGTKVTYLFSSIVA